MKKPLYSFLSIVPLVILLGCESEKGISQKCNGPSSIGSDGACFQSENDLEVYAIGFQSMTNSVAFSWHVYPQTDQNTIDLSESNEKYATTGGDHITIPRDHIDDFPTFVLKATILCDGQAYNSIQYVFNLITQHGCQVWVGQKL